MRARPSCQRPPIELKPAIPRAELISSGPTEVRMETEKAFLEALTKVKSFRITGQGLDLLDGDGNVLATFEASPAPAAEA